MSSLPSSPALYWIALNLIPWPPARLRGLHRRLGDASALDSVRAGELVRLVPGRPSRRGAPAPSGPGRPAWWEQVTSGSLTMESSLDHVDVAWDGRRLLEEAARELRRAEEAGLAVIAACDPRYPALLRAIDAPPAVLYALGDATLLGPLPPDADRPCPEPDWWRDGPAGPARRGEPPAGTRVNLAVVGSRRATDYGRAVARRLGRAIASRGGVTVSGLALGIDAESHRGALEAPGPTVAVPGGGLGAARWPVANHRIAERIVRSGLIVSEFPLDTASSAHHFPRRNRIISGLSGATVVVEAAARSGALITARLALEQGRDVFVVPGRMTDPMSAGANALLRDGAAAPMVSLDALFEDLAPVWRNGLAPPPGREAPAGGLFPPAGSRAAAPETGLDPVERTLLGMLRTDEPLSIDELVRRSVGASEVLAALVSLEIRGLAVALPGGRYLLAP